MNKKKRAEIFAILDKEIGNPVSELNYRSPFELLVSVILSAQATDRSVNKATAKLYPVAKTPEAMLALGESGLKELIKSIGLYNTKAKNIIKTCQILIEKHQGEVPDSRKELEALPGVGRKTANVVLNIAFGQPTMAVDTHIFRLGNRTKLATGKTPREVEDKLIKFTPKEFIYKAHHLLILHGRYTCVARKPHCESCAIFSLCEYKDKHSSNNRCEKSI